MKKNKAPHMIQQLLHVHTYTYNDQGTAYDNKNMVYND